MSQHPKILIVDDEDSIRRVLKLHLSAQSYRLEEATSAKSALEKARDFHPNLIILDLGLPDSNGMEVLKSIRSWSDVPVIILTVTDDEKTKVELLESGADDYITKPFSVLELGARIKVALRHRSVEAEANPVFQSGDLKIDLGSKEVTLRSLRVHLTATEFSILRVLVRARGQVVQQEAILREVWGPNAVDNPHYLRIYVGQIRKKLEADPSNPAHVLTEPALGYKLI
jgi:two-component system KDP operon response regulator KdpE